ncbi:proteasome subunit alpha [Candidatus Poribacteria bacterium]|nr:proteasome subunit alpha [Candidatus Poribacteria bacterium]
MPAPFYVSPEQIFRDKAQYARSGIEKGKDVIAIEYIDGIIMVAENPQKTLNKISEIYDRIAFAGVGIYQEYEPLRYQGVQAAEIKGYTYSREDVHAKWLATIYSQIIDSVYRQLDMKPLEIEILVAEVGDELYPKNNIYHIAFDGKLWEERDFAVIGGNSDKLREYLQHQFRENLTPSEALKLTTKALSTLEDSHVTHETLEVGVLDKNRGRRKFKRLTPEEISELLEA